MIQIRREQEHTIICEHAYYVFKHFVEMLLIKCNIQVCPLEVDIDQKVGFHLMKQPLLEDYFCFSLKLLFKQ